MRGRAHSPAWTPFRTVLLCLAASPFVVALEETVVPNGVPLPFELTGGEPNRHPLALEAGQLLDVELRERSSRLGLALLDPSGAVAARREVAGESITTVRLLAVAPVAGLYTLEVRAQSPGAPGGYTLGIQPPRAAGTAERTRVSGDEVHAEALREAAKGTPDGRRGALERLAVAEKAFGETGDRLGLALVLQDRGTVQLALGDLAAGPSSYERALDLFRRMDHAEGEAAALCGLGRAKLAQGELELAGQLFDRALERAGAANPRTVAYYTSNAGIVLARTGRYEGAIARFSRAAELVAPTGDGRGQGRALTNLASAHKELGDYERAAAIYDRALAVWEKAGQRDGMLMTLVNLGNMALLQDDVERAQALLEKALPLAEGTGTDEEGRLLMNLAAIHRRRGDLPRAVPLAERSLEIRRRAAQPRGIASSLQILADCVRDAGDPELALRHLTEALALQQSIQDAYLGSETLSRMAELERSGGRLKEAVQHAEQAVSLVESLRASVTNPDLRASFVAVERVKYDLLVDVLMRLHEQDPAAGHDAAALAVSERASARVLLDSLVEARADIRAGVDAALLARERELQKRMTEGSTRLSSLLARQAPAGDVEPARAALEAASEEYRQLQATIRAQSPRYAALTQPQPPTLEQLRQDALDEGTLLLEYFLGDDRSVLWVVGRKELVSVSLPARRRIEEPARRIHELLSERQRSRGAAARAADERLRAESAALSEVLLGGIAPRLRADWRGKRLLIVAPGALAYVPFAALPLPGDAGGRPLLDGHEVVYAPSASVLIALRREPPPVTERSTVAVLADPVFEADDPRVGRSGGHASRAPQPVGLGRAMRSLGRDHFTRLPFSRAEAAALASLVPERDLLRATDFAASRALVDEGALAGRRIVHFATHGILDTAHPDLSGLVLSLVDEKGRPRDGFLRMHEIYNLRLPADLVVLSACQTALGREVRGEGLVGLTRGFLYAGARRVMASLWQVDDESSAELMRRFYRAHLRDGQPPAAALRAAQAEMSRDRRFAAPFYWAAFTLTGDWR